ncbi:MAG: 23S rRNA (pseudouridine(1915)-N(3))-methyltransferase RlmH [Rickettsiaceae bacterium]|nr:MAG: 23S rRNA (pseudouridine(1915)-N(3))-methyltransferase RlmH [Rickettsiaceae bacterium]
MRSVHIISIGKIAEELGKLLFDYKKMIKADVKLIDISYSEKLPANLIKEYEAKKILNHLRQKSFKVALDIRGSYMDSHDFANIVANKTDIDFVIGGAFGLSSTILENVDLRFSLSKMTFPYAIAKLILLEQIYRAQTILDNHPYHK